MGCNSLSGRRWRLIDLYVNLEGFTVVNAVDNVLLGRIVVYEGLFRGQVDGHARLKQTMDGHEGGAKLLGVVDIAQFGADSPFAGGGGLGAVSEFHLNLGSGVKVSQPAHGVGEMLTGSGVEFKDQLDEVNEQNDDFVPFSFEQFTIASYSTEN